MHAEVRENFHHRIHDLLVPENVAPWFESIKAFFRRHSIHNQRVGESLQADRQRRVATPDVRSDVCVYLKNSVP